ncbi:hypothetical protein RVR_2107 [Actinacidiphila reveromycinica]|uniref:Uncharacterized protein n=1 Tax=Actinacidiphila reveromycinica TaxID=659352 RepID=A0A7U3UQ26_9ACTN|nr:hypothetical protein [Streptomyces sp. SN-593]BBA96692.1 hypothetical protein RVR_2107 [Streptomyces sp. SN-593]
MAPLKTLTRPDTRGTAPQPAGVRLSGVVHEVFRERSQPLIGGDVRLAQDMLRAYGRADEFASFLARTGNSFIAMSDRLLTRLPEPLPELDAVLLAYQSPDLYYSDVAGCYLAQLPGAPVPCSVAEQGPGAPFTALRIADGMARLGELRHGALFVYDQNAAVWEANEEVQRRPDAAVLLALDGDGDGDVLVTALDEVRTREEDDPTPAEALEQAVAAHGGPAVLIGPSLAAAVAGSPVADRVTAAPDEACCTGVWAELGRRLPLTEPLLLADHDSAAGRFHSCLLVPAGAPEEDRLP